MYYVLKFSQKNSVLLRVYCFNYKGDAQFYLQSVSNKSRYYYKTYFLLDSELITFLENKGDLVSL